MIDESFEWAIKKDVRNNPIVREVDRERHREMWRSVAISVFLVVVVLFSAWQQLELRVRYGYGMEEMQQQRADEAEIHRHLSLEIETLRAPHVIERRAKRELHMVAPGPAEATIIERVVRPEAPPRTVIARR
jgi:cell division protein FtsL